MRTQELHFDYRCGKRQANRSWGDMQDLQARYVCELSHARRRSYRVRRICANLAPIKQLAILLLASQWSQMGAPRHLR
jgi:hypothetical protein